MIWFHRDWWAYLFAPMRGWRYDDEWFWRLKVVWCRMRGHPSGMRWYSNELEPDTHCIDCGDDIG
jgi:hypothetical protein